MHGAWFGKWVISSRFEAHVAWPLLVGAILLGLYFLGTYALQSAVAPGVSIGGGRSLAVPDAIEVFLLAWTLLLAAPILRVSRDRLPALLAAVIGLYALTSLVLQVRGTVSLNAGLPVLRVVDGRWSELPVLGHMDPVDLLAGTVTLLFFTVLPLLYGDRRHPVHAMLVPSRWMLATCAVMLVTWWSARSLHAAGWGRMYGEAGALGDDFTVFPALVLHYMVLLFTAELRYRVAVRRAGPPIVRHL